MWKNDVIRSAMVSAILFAEEEARNDPDPAGLILTMLDFAGAGPLGAVAPW